MTSCDGKGAPVKGCACGFCRSVYGDPIPEHVRLDGPSGDFLEDDDGD